MTDLDALAAQSGIIPVEKLNSLIASLKKVPDFSWVMASPHALEARLQGDLLRDFPVSFIDREGKALSSRLTVLLMNNTCDLQPHRSKAVTVAPVLDFQAFASAEIKKRGFASVQSYLHAARSNEIDELIWLPPFATFPDGAIVYLDRLSSISAEFYENSLMQRVASFSQNGFYFFLMKVTNHFARSESTEVERAG